MRNNIIIKVRFIQIVPNGLGYGFVAENVRMTFPPYLKIVKLPK